MKKNSVSNKNEIYITLKSERNYYQGDVIDGTVVLDLITATKTQNVKLILEGIAMIHNKPTIIYTTTQVLMEPPTGEKFVALEAHSHRYNFHINAPSSKALPSTLDIPGLLSIQYKLIAVQTVQFGLWDFPKVHPTTEKEVNILEHIDVSEFPMNYNEIREVALMGLDKKIRVAVDLLRSAAVKGATIPISVTIDHVGVMVKDKAIKVRLFRNVYHRNTRLNINGPEMISSTNGNIMITGPIDFTATTKLKLIIPSKICPTVEETGKTFKVEYLVNVVVNLNEESPHIKEREEEVVIFDVPFTIGTYPQLDYCIDDDDDDDDAGQAYGLPKNNSSEVEKVSINNKINNNNHTADFSNDVVKVLDQVNLNSSGSVLPQMIEEQHQQKESTPLEGYKPDEKPEPVSPPKRRTMTYESGVQLPEFIESEPTLPGQIIEIKKKDIPQNIIKNNNEEEKDAVLPQAAEDEENEEEELSLPQEQQNAVLPEELPTKHYNKQKEEEERPMNAHSSLSSSSFIKSDSCTPPTSSMENVTFLPTPISESRPSSPSLTYQGSSPVVTNNNTSNVSLPMQTTTYTTVNNTGINITEDPYQLPTELSSPPPPPPLEKRASYLSMNNIPESPSLPLQIDQNAENRRPLLPPRNNSPFALPYNNSNENLTNSNLNNNTINTPPIPPRLNNNVSPVFNGRPPLPPRTSTVSPSNNNGGYGSPSPPPQYNNGMPQPYQRNNFYNNYHNGSSSSLYNQSPPPPLSPPQTTTLPNGMPMPMPSPSHSQSTNNYPQRPSSTAPTSYPELSFNMPTPQYPQQHQQQQQQQNQHHYYRH